MDAFVVMDNNQVKTIAFSGNWCIRFSGNDMSECGYTENDTVFVIVKDKNTIQLYNKDGLNHKNPCDNTLGDSTNFKTSTR